MKMDQNIEYLNRDDGSVAAIIVRAQTAFKSGVDFITNDLALLQIGLMKHDGGVKIVPHEHLPVRREIQDTWEVLFIRKGSVRMFIYNRSREPLAERVLSIGDLVMLCGGAHGFEAITNLEMVEIKQGPYVGIADKTKF